jgi:hypothetical protein
MTYKTSAFMFVASLAFALGIIMVLPVVSNQRVRSDGPVVDRSELVSAQLSRVWLVIGNVK